MTVNDLLKGRHNCECGIDHTCDIQYVSIRSGALDDLAAFVEPYRHILLVADNNTYSACGEKVSEILAGKLENRVIFETKGFLIPNENSIGVIEASLSEATDLVIGIGSGVVNDLCKYTSFYRSLPYAIIATAPSMDGYASKGAAMITDNMKMTYNTHVPTAIIGDVNILKDAPMDMIQSGFGDIIGKYSALNDWKLSHLINGEPLCEYVYSLTMDTVKKTETLANGILKRDPETIKTLMEALVIVGIAMSYVGNSRPASGSEHHFSHYFEITGILNHKEYFLHGIDVVYSTVKTQIMREELLKIKALPSSLPAFDRCEWEQNIRRIYGKAADGVIALQDRCGYYKKDYETIYAEKWPQIREVLAEVPSSDSLMSILSTVGLDYTVFTNHYGEDCLRDGAFFAKDLKDRYTFLWIYYRLFYRANAIEA